MPLPKASQATAGQLCYNDNWIIKTEQQSSATAVATVAF